MALTILGMTIGADGEHFHLPTHAQIRSALCSHMEHLHGRPLAEISTTLSRGEVVNLLTLVADMAIGVAAEALAFAHADGKDAPAVAALAEVG
jgi:hypothetical protein